MSDSDTNSSWCTCTTVPKGLERGLEQLEIRGRLKTIKITALLRSARILTRILDTWGDLLSLRLLWKLTDVRWQKKLTRNKIIIIRSRKGCKKISLSIKISSCIPYYIFHNIKGYHMHNIILSNVYHILFHDNVMKYILTCPL